MISVEKVKQLKVLDDKVINFIKNEVEGYEWGDDGNPFNQISMIELDNITYSINEFAEDEWEDDGKYQYQTITYQVVSIDQNTYDTIDEFNLFIDVSVSRSGSYYSDYYYNYELSRFFVCDIKTIPEQVIPEHKEVRVKNL